MASGKWWMGYPFALHPGVEEVWRHQAVIYRLQNHHFIWGTIRLLTCHCHDTMTLATVEGSYRLDQYGAGKIFVVTCPVSSGHTRPATALLRQAELSGTIQLPFNSSQIFTVDLFHVK
jgi:hypothetical protein